MKIGYIRVSTQEQNTIRQEVLMESLDVDKVYIGRMYNRVVLGLFECRTQDSKTKEIYHPDIKREKLS